MIAPARVIPVHEMWALTPESTAQTDAALKDYKAGRTVGSKSLDAKLAAKRARRGGK